MVIGEVQDICSNPNSTTGVYSIPANSTFFAYPSTPPNEVAYKIRWNDGTIDLAFYISVLAMEYKLLKDGGWDTSSTLEELYFAMKAFERLDSWSAKWYYSNPNNTCISNGYFIRDDVDSNAKIRFDENEVFVKYKTNNTYSYHSDYIPRNSVGGGSTITPDQVHQLMAAFKLVEKCVVDPSIKYNDYSFVKSAISNGIGTANYLAQRNIDWRIKDEFGNSTPQFHNAYREFGVGFITAKAAGFIDPNNSSKHYLRHISEFTTFFWKIKLRGFNTLVKRNYINHDFAIAHVACGLAVGDAYHVFNNNKTDEFLGLLADKPDLDLGYYHLLYNYLRDKNNGRADLYQDLQKAPGYGTQYRPRITDNPYHTGAEEWRANNRWVRPWKRSDNSEDYHKTNGLDYMALYNLYNLYFKNSSYVGNIPERAPGINLKISTSKSIDYNIHSFNWAELSSKIKPIGSITISASNSITLEKGFSATGNLELKITGPINACGDRLDETGELAIPLGIQPKCFEQTAGRIVNNQRILETNSTIAQNNTNNYKPLSDYLSERNQKDLQDEYSINIYPNPFSDKSYVGIYFESPQTVDIDIFDIRGNHICTEYKQKLIDSGESVLTLINSPKLNPGLYIVQIKTNSFTLDKKLIKR